MKEPEFITIGSYTYSRALLIKVRLETAGIPCLLGEGGGAANEVVLRINESDLGEARQIIDEMAEASGSDKEATIKLLRSVRRILVPVDFSEESEKAARYALMLASYMKADIRLMHAWFPVPAEHFAWGEMYAMQSDIEAQMRAAEAEATKQLGFMQERLKLQIKQQKIRGVDVDYDLLRGNPSDAISAVAHHYKPGLIVMGTKGRNRIQRSFFGSTTQRAISKGKIPVLAIPPNYAEKVLDKTQRLLYVTNFDHTDYDSLSRLMAFVRPFNTKIYCLHINKQGSNIVDETRMRNMRRYFNEQYQRFDIECGLLQSEDTLEGIETFIETNTIDVLAITARKQNILEQLFDPGLSRKLLFRSSIPLLIFGGVS